MLSFGPAKILILLAVALIVLGPEKLPQMSRQIGKAWGDFRRFREHLEGEVRGALGEDLMQAYTPPWQVDGSSGSTAATGADAGSGDGAVTGGTPPADGSASSHGAEDHTSPPAPGQLAPLPPPTGSGTPAARGWDPGLAPDDPSLN